MAGSGRKAVVLGLMLLALCTFQRHKFHVSGASVRRSFATLVGPSLNAPQVERVEDAKGSNLDVNSVAVESDDAEVEHTDFIPVDHENLRWSEDSAHGGANNGHVGHSRTRSGQCLTGNPDGCRASVLRSLRVDVLVKSLRLHRWGIRTATDATGAASDAAASASDADLADDWSAMSSDEVDLFFPDESEDNEDGTVGETVILQLQA